MRKSPDPSPRRHDLRGSGKLGRQHDLRVLTGARRPALTAEGLLGIGQRDHPIDQRATSFIGSEINDSGSSD